ncbi:protein phosphatase 2C domain-containing protein [Streptomyces sp. NPDC047046]|uniref:protein phosphatase 2C domain-containing protein n=1 Tax=Streptomyces sp. NPDC047046 TaxID=3155378 RepID=UPI0033D9D54C
MSQQGDAREDDWWDQLYEESAPDTGPDRAADTLDDRFASAVHTVKPSQEPVTREDPPPPGNPGATAPASPRTFAPAPPEPAAPWPAAERLGRPYVPGARPLPPKAEDDGRLPAEGGRLPVEAEDDPPLPQRPLPRGTEENRPLPRRPLAPQVPEAADSPPLPRRPPRREPAAPEGFTGWFGTSPERSAGDTPPPLPAAWTGVTPRSGKGTPADAAGPSDAEPKTPERAHGAPETPPAPEGFGPLREDLPREPSSAAPEPVGDRPEPVGDQPEPVRDEWTAPGSVRSEPEPVRDGGTPSQPVPDEPAPPQPRLPRHALPPSPAPSRDTEAERATPAGQGTPAQPPSAPGEAGAAPAGWQGAPPAADGEARTAPVPPLPPRPVPGRAPGGPAWPGYGAGPAAAPAASPPAAVPPPPASAAPPSPAPERPPTAPGDARPAAPKAPRTPPPLPATSVPYVGDRPPTYEAEPTALAESDPGALDAYVPDTVLEGGRFGGSTLRAVSQRGDSARYRGEARRDALLVVRFGAGEEGIVLVATATGARACPEAYRAATEAVRSIGAAVGRSHRRLADDIRAARRGDLKSGLHRLTDRTLGRLRAAAAERGLAPEEYTASLRCLLLPTDNQSRTRVFFGAGEGGLFRLRGGELRDIEPGAQADGPPRSGPEAGALPLDPGIGRPPSPYAPAEEPRREPFRFHASIARSGDVLLLCGTGLAEPLRGSPPLASRLAEEWSAPEPPGLAAFLATSQTRVKGYADDRTLAAVWEG